MKFSFFLGLIVDGSASRWRITRARTVLMRAAMRYVVVVSARSGSASCLYAGGSSIW